MDYEMKMPDLSTAAEEVTITEWFIEVGESVERGQPILNVETDKAEMEVESVVKGTLKQVVAQDGDAVATGAVIAIFEVDAAPGSAAPAAASPAAAPPPPPAESPAPAPKKPGSGGGMFARNRERRDG